MRKVKIKQINSGVFFPPLESTLELLGLPSGVAACTREVKSRTGKPLPAENKTLNKITTQGIGRKKALEVFDYIVSENDLANDSLSMFSLFNHDFRKKMADITSQSPCNGYAWDIFLDGFEKRCDFGLPKTIAFLKKRIEAGKKAHQGNTQSEEWLHRYIQIVSENMLVDRALVEDIYRCIAHNPEVPKSVLLLEHKEFLSVVAVDFYFWLLAYIEQDLSDILVSELSLNDEEQSQAREGTIQHILPKLDDQQKVVGSLALLLDRWRTIFSSQILQKEKPITISEFAKYMPAPVFTDKKPGEMSQEDLKKSKYRAFCDWRSGNKIPSDDKLERFIAQLLPECRQRHWWLWFAKIAIAMDKLFKKITDGGAFGKTGAIALFQTYKNYHREVRQRNANK